MDLETKTRAKLHLQEFSRHQQYTIRENSWIKNKTGKAIKWCKSVESLFNWLQKHGHSCSFTACLSRRVGQGIRIMRNISLTWEYRLRRPCNRNVEKHATGRFLIFKVLWFPHSHYTQYLPPHNQVYNTNFIYITPCVLHPSIHQKCNSSRFYYLSSG